MQNYNNINYLLINKSIFYNENDKRLSPDLSNIDILIRNNTDSSCAINDQVLVFFGAWNDNFGAIYNIIKFYSGPFIYLIDRENKWYSNKLNTYLTFIRDMDKICNINVNNYVFMGFSMGGYPALYLSVLYPNKKCICITITPQVLNYFNFNNKVFLKDLQLGSDEEPPYVTSVFNINKNIQQHFLENNNNNIKIYILVGKSECSDYKKYNIHMYLDIFHAASLSNLNNVYICIFNRTTHVLAIELDLPYMYNLVLNNFNNLYENMEKGLVDIGLMSYRDTINNKKIHDIAILYGNIDDKASNIIPELQKLILEPIEAKNISLAVTKLNPCISSSYLLCPLIWSALYINGYDIPQHFLRNSYITSIESDFSFYCIQLSKLHGWDKYAIYSLLYNKAIINDKSLSQLSDRYCKISKNFNFNNYKRKDHIGGSTNIYYKKYLKYKEKYLRLKSPRM